MDDAAQESYPTGNVVEIPGFPGSNLLSLSPQEVVQLWEHLDRVEGLSIDGHAATDELYPRLEVYRGLHDVIGDIPERDVTFGRQVFTEFANSSNPQVREMLGSWIPSLTRADHDFGLALWDRLVRDEDHHVRREGAIFLREYSEMKRHARPEEVDHERRRLGLTDEEVSQLLHHYEDAKHGRGIFSLGEAVLQKLVGATNPLAYQS